jgi:cytochrome c
MKFGDRTLARLQSMKRNNALPMAGFLALCFVGQASAQVDADAAEALAKESNCFKCHAIDRKKIGPPYKEVAAKHERRPDAEEKLIKHITTGPIVKIGGDEINHQIVKSKDPAEIRNLVRWILSL